MHFASPISIRRTVLVLRAAAVAVSGLRFAGGADQRLSSCVRNGPLRGQDHGR